MASQHSHVALVHNFRITWQGYTVSTTETEVVSFDNQRDTVLFIDRLLTAGVIDFRLTHNVWTEIEGDASGATQEAETAG